MPVRMTIKHTIIYTPKDLDPDRDILDIARAEAQAISDDSLDLQGLMDRYGIEDFDLSVEAEVV